MDALLFASTLIAQVNFLRRSNKMGNYFPSKANASNLLLLEPAMNGDLSAIEAAVADVPKEMIANALNSTDAAGNAAIHGAIFGGNLNVVEFLALNGASIVSANGLGCTPIWLAAGYNRIEILIFLLQHLKDTELETSNNTGDSPFIAAASKGHFKVCRILLENVTDPSTLKTDVNHSKDSALSVALAAGVNDKDEITMLSDSSVLNRLNSKGVTPLLIACERDLATAVHTLIQLGANTEILDANGHSILAVAAFCGSNDVVDLLLNNPTASKIDLLDKVNTLSGCSPLWLASRAGHVKCTRLLLHAGADTSLANKDGLTPLQVAEKHNRMDIMETLTASFSG